MWRACYFLACLVIAAVAILTALILQAGETPKTATGGVDPAPNPALEAILRRMDKTAEDFRSAAANFVWEQYQKVVNDTDTQKGKIYFRRQGKEVQMAAEITDPEKKYVLFSGGKVDMLQPRINQVTEYNVGKNRAELEGLLLLGFGGSGHDLLQSYEVKYAGREQLGDVDTEKLELVPKSVKFRNNVERIVLWIDPARGISKQQQFFQPGGDYRLAKYSDIELNQKVPDSAFKLKTDSKTKFVTPQG